MNPSQFITKEEVYTVVAQMQAEMTVEILHQEESTQETVTAKDLKAEHLKEVETVTLSVVKEISTEITPTLSVATEILTETTPALHSKKTKEEILKEGSTYQEVVVTKAEMINLPVTLVIEEKNGNNQDKIKFDIYQFL